MCGIAGFYDPHADYTAQAPKWHQILDAMNRAQERRGPDNEGIYLDRSCGLAHVRLEIIDLVTGQQPMVRKMQGRECAISFNGEIYNMNELKEELLQEGAVFRTTSDTEVILTGYMMYGKDYVKKLNGIFAIALWDSFSGEICLFRDRLGVKPLFYTVQGGTLVFASEIKGLFAYPGVRPLLDQDGLCEIFALGPAKSYGKGVFKDIREVLPGHCLICGRDRLRTEAYWKLESRPHGDTMEETVEKTAWLVEDAVKNRCCPISPSVRFSPEAWTAAWSRRSARKN